MATVLVAALATVTAGLAQKGAGGESRRLLPAPADGWRLERLDLPLSFAPGLDYRGREEIQFAPGMFDPQAAGHWSFGFAIEIEGEHRADAEFWTRFFTSYYRGLCGNVAAGRGLTIDTASIAVSAEATAAGKTDAGTHLLRADIYDVFATGAPLGLSIEVTSQQLADKTILFAIGSPAAPTEKIWDALAQLRRGWRAELPLALGLNHIFFIPDAETYAALAASEELRELGAFEARSTERSDTSYEGLYWYGDRSYFECVAPASETGGALRIGTSGIALGIERHGGTATLEAALKAADIRSFVGSRTRTVDGGARDWFRALGVEDAHAASRFSLFSMEYAPDLLGPAGGIRRGDVLEHYKQNGAASRTAPAFGDVMAVELALDPQEHARFEACCRVFGYAKDTSAKDGVARWRAPGCTFTLTKSASPGGITSFRVALLRPIEREAIICGKLRVEFGRDSAVFRLRQGDKSEK